MVVDCGGSRGDEARIAHRTEIFRRVEAERRCIPQSARGNAVPRGSKSLSSVFDQQQIVLFLESRECVPVRALTVEMNGQDGLHLRTSVRAKEFFGRSWAKIEGPRVDISQQRLRSAAQNSADARKKTEGRRDDGVAGADVRSSQRKPDCVRTAGASNSVRYGAGTSGGLLKACDRGAENESLRRAHRLDRIQQFLANTGILAGEIKHLNGLRVAYRHLLPWYIRATEWRLSLTHCLRLIPLEPLQSAAAGGGRSCPGLIIVVDARIVDSLGLRLGKSG